MLIVDVDIKVKKMNIGQLIKDKRIALSMSQKELADNLNISVQRLNNFENESRVPSISLLNELSSLLDFDIDNPNKKRNPNYTINHTLFIIPNFIEFYNSFLNFFGTSRQQLR